MADKAKLSLGAGKSVCGIEIKKLPIGAYLKALERIKEIPGEFLDTVFQGRNFNEILNELGSIDNDDLKALLGSMMFAAPKYIVAVVAELTGVDEKRLIEDEAIGLDGLVEIIDAFIEVNRLGKFISQARGLFTKIKANPMT